MCTDLNFRKGLKKVGKMRRGKLRADKTTTSLLKQSVHLSFQTLILFDHRERIFFVPKGTRVEPGMWEEKGRYGSQAPGPRLQEHVCAVWTSILTSNTSRTLGAQQSCLYRLLIRCSKTKVNSKHSKQKDITVCNKLKNILPKKYRVFTG